jgi:hypothetical protein
MSMAALPARLANAPYRQVFRQACSNHIDINPKPIDATQPALWAGRCSFESTDQVANGSGDRVGSCSLRSARTVLLCVATVSLVACGDGAGRAAAGFSPARAIVREQGRIARCNTVHSQTLAAAVMRRYGLNAGMKPE